MGTLKDRARPPYAPERKYRRFDLRCPVRVKFPSGDAIAQVEAISKNVSIGGLLLECSSMIPPRRPVSFVMTVEGDQLPRPIQLRGDGEVVRIEPRKGEAGFTVAVECKHPMSWMEGHVSAAAG